MRNKFLGYYKPTKEELAAMWNECIFVFDTSTLLNIYRYVIPLKRGRIFLKS